MKKIVTIITSLLLCMTMLILSPVRIAAAETKKEKKLYISEVRIGMGESKEKAAKQLKDDGYTILTNDEGEYADLNEDAGSKNSLKKGPNQKVVYLGYKTTEKASEAITDLAVMNMNGSYQIQDYATMLSLNMETTIKPFVDRFIATLNEYRENLKKSKDSVNYKRADFYRKLLNKMTDDDTGGKPLGDLLLNKTKYEMGDEAYNKLSDEEKKNHCDILTLLMQGNGQAVMLLETEITRAADTAEDTWLDRFVKTDLESLTQSVKDEYPVFTLYDINQELDKKYNDDAKKIREKWTAFNNILSNYDDAVEKAEEVAETENDSKKEVELNEKSSDKEILDAASDMLETSATLVKGGMAIEDIAVKDYLESIEYGDGNLLEFFERDVSEFSDEDTIRELYPIVEALSGGQLAGLDFLSIQDMIMMTVISDDALKSVDERIEKMKPASIYQGVKRENYEPNAVAVTVGSMQNFASPQMNFKYLKLLGLGAVCETCSAIYGLAAGIATYFLDPPKLGSSGAEAVKNASKRLESIIDTSSENHDRMTSFIDGSSDSGNILSDKLSTGSLDEVNNISNTDVIDTNNVRKFVEEQVIIDDTDLNNNITRDSEDRFKQVLNDDNFGESTARNALKSTICKGITAGLAVITAALAAWSLYNAFAQEVESYNVSFLPIPKYMVNATDITVVNEKGETVTVPKQSAYYKVAFCNRDDGSSSVEKENHKVLLDRNDLNGDVGKQWLSLYTLKYANAMPILANSLKFKQKSSDFPAGYTEGIHQFGKSTSAVFNLTHPYFCYNDPNDGTYVYFKHDTVPFKMPTAAGSMFSGGSIAIGALIGLAAGSAITMLLSFSIRKRKQRKAGLA